MTTKYQMISMLAEETAKQIARNGQEWMKYLDTAARLYKYPLTSRCSSMPKDPMRVPALPLKHGMKNELLGKPWGKGDRPD